jgi:hypothetical protein
MKKIFLISIYFEFQVFLSCPGPSPGFFVNFIYLALAMMMSMLSLVGVACAVDSVGPAAETVAFSGREIYGSPILTARACAG